DGAGLLEMAGDVRAVLLEKFEEETGIDRVLDQPIGERHRHRAEADLHRARPLHAHSSGVGLLELAHGLLPGALPAWIAGQPDGARLAPTPGGDGGPRRRTASRAAAPFAPGRRARARSRAAVSSARDSRSTPDPSGRLLAGDQRGADDLLHLRDARFPSFAP